MREEYIKRARSDSAFVDALDSANTRVEPIYRRLDALRVNLAKHEVKGQRGMPAMAPGYSRIDEGTGSMSWTVDLGNVVIDGETLRHVDTISRRDLANELRLAVIGRLLPGDEVETEEFDQGETDEFGQ